MWWQRISLLYTLLGRIADTCSELNMRRLELYALDAFLYYICGELWNMEYLQSATWKKITMSFV